MATQQQQQQQQQQRQWRPRRQHEDRPTDYSDECSGWHVADALHVAVLDPTLVDRRLSGIEGHPRPWQW